MHDAVGRGPTNDIVIGTRSLEGLQNQRSLMSSWLEGAIGGCVEVASGEIGRRSMQKLGREQIKWTAVTLRLQR